LTTRRYSKGTFQMLWDCPACDTKKLLGVDHRFCPNCGSPQEENLRYFPKPGERVPTKFLGRTPDWECGHCGVPNGGNNCMGCGAPRGDSKSVHVRPSIPEHEGETGAQAQRDWDGRRAARRAEQYANAGMEAHRRRERARADEYKRRRAAAERANAQAAGMTWDPPDLDDTDYSVVNRNRDLRFWAIAGSVIFAFAFVLTCAFWKKDVTVKAQGHTWERGIEVEQYKTVSESDWCNSMPGDAYSVSRSREIHHYDQVYDGEECHTVPGGCTETCRNVDNGNGSYSVDCTQTCTPDRQECRSKYRDEPVYRMKCYYTVDRWRHERWDTSKGSSREPAPAWPKPLFRECMSQRIGCERLGSKRSTYTVHYVAPEEGYKPFSCDFPQNKWEKIKPDSKWIARVGVISKSIDCDSLRKPQ